MRSVENPNVNVRLDKEAYAYFEVTHSVGDEEISAGEVEFKVENSWIDDIVADNKEIALFRYTSSNEGEGWSEMDTEFMYSEGQYSYYKATLPGLSLFAISTKTEPINAGVGGFEDYGTIMIWVLIALVAIVLVVLMIWIVRIKAKPLVSNVKVENEYKTGRMSDTELMRKAKNIARDALVKGYSLWEIRGEFKSKGWSDKEIDSILG